MNLQFYLQMILTLVYITYHNRTLVYGSVLVGIDVTFEPLSSSDIDTSSVVQAITSTHNLCISYPVESAWCNFTKQQFGVVMQGQLN
jgi:hypothetical protein